MHQWIDWRTIFLYLLLYSCIPSPTPGVLFCINLWWCFPCFFPFQSCGRYTSISRSFFSSQEFGPGVPLGNGVECWRGYYQSLRPTQMGLSLNIGRVVLVPNAFLYLKSQLLAHSIVFSHLHIVYGASVYYLHMHP